MWVGVLGKIKNFKSLNELVEYISLELFFGFVKICDTRTLHTGELQKFSKFIKSVVYLEYEKTTNPITPIAFGIC